MEIEIKPNEAETKLLEFPSEQRSETYRSLTETHRVCAKRLYPWQILEKAKLIGAAEVLDKMAESWSAKD